MRRFLGSAWFPLVVCLVLAGVTAGAFALLAPDGESIGQSEIAKWAGIVAWAIGPVAGLLTFLKIGVLNLIRRLVRLRRVEWLHPVVILIGTVSTMVFAWIMAGEPLFTPIGRAVVAFAGRPLLWGSLIATLLTIVLSIPLLLPKKK